MNRASADHGQGSADIAIVGGGAAGAALATLLASHGRDVVVFERRAQPRWRAAGVYSSPRTWAALAALGLEPAVIQEVLRPIHAIDVGTTTGAVCRLEHDAPFACGVDRVRLDRVLLDRAAAAGARVHEGVAVREVRLERGRARLHTEGPEGGSCEWSVGTVVGADGPRSMVARAAGVDRGLPWLQRVGLTVHRADPDAASSMPPTVATMTLGPGWYCGIAPVPGCRVNIGIVMPLDHLRRELRSARPKALVQRVVDALPGPESSWRQAPDTDQLAVASPLAHRPGRLAGPAWMLVGDAAGFLDPLSGEGLQRAFRSATRAAEVLLTSGPGAAAAATYHRWMRARYRPKDVLSWLLQAFFAQQRLAGYALTRLARRPALARTFNAVLTDLAPATRALDPRFLARVLAP